jgi:hypothetical protein
MLHDKTRMMLEVANQLTADDIESLKAGTPIVPNRADAAVVPPRVPQAVRHADYPRSCHEHVTRCV